MQVKQPSTSLLTITFMCIVICTLLSTCGQEQERAAPEFKISLYDTLDFESGQTRKFPTRDSKIHVINFWFPSCPPCIAEMPELNKFYLEYKDSVEVTAIQLIGLDSLEDGQRFVTNKKIAFAVGADLDGSITTNYMSKSPVFPSTFFVSPDGNIAKVWQGQITANELEEFVTPMINGKGG